MPEHRVVGIYETLAKAEPAVRQLDGEGFPLQQVSIIGHGAERELQVQGYVTVEDEARQAFAAGPWPSGIDLMIGAGAVAEIEFSSISFPEYGFAPSDGNISVHFRAPEPGRTEGGAPGDATKSPTLGRGLPRSLPCHRK
jgi:hypothetical protein